MERKKILIWGEAGVGKTTFCSKLCQDWALVVKETEGKGQELTQEQKSELDKLTEEQRSKLNNIGLLFYICLRDIGSKTVKDIIISKLGFNKLNDSQFLSILENVNECGKFVIVMDGFDEVSDEDKQVEEVLTGPSYHNIHSIITCRPHAIRGVVLNVDVEIRLMGFSEAQAKAFVEMFARIKYNDQNQIESFVKQTMSQIESSADLLEMSTNPSMLQLLCLLSWKKGKIGKNRTSVFKYYTHYLLVQYHIKLGKNEKLYSNDLYKQNLLDAGKVALMGLKQNQLQLVFSKSLAHQIGGNAIFDIDFLTELPCAEIDETDTDTKVQFTHKTLQEYLAAYYVVNSPGDEELQLVMQFCCTSQRLMGSQIILEFVSNLSTKVGKRIQKQIQDCVSSWDSDDKVDPKSRTSFLISMLKGNKTLTFPLPAVVDIDLREFDFISHRFKKFFMFLYRQKSALEKFFDMDGSGVKKLILIVGEYNRVNVLQNMTTDLVNELSIDYCNTWFKKDSKELCEVMKNMKPGLLCITACQRTLMDKATVDLISQHVHTLILVKCDLDNVHLLIILQKVKDATMKSFSICNCRMKINSEIAEAVSRLPDHTQLDLSGNKVTDKSACITLIHKAATMKSLSICNCDIQIDTEIAEAVSRLPDHIQLDLSGNDITKMEPYLLSRILLYMTKQKKIDIDGWGITVDADIVRALSKLSKLQTLVINKGIFNNNKLTPRASSELPHTVSSMPHLQVLYLDVCDISNDAMVALTDSLYKHCPLLGQLSLRHNHLSSGVWEVVKHIQQMKNLVDLWLWTNPCVKDDKQRDEIRNTFQRSKPGLNVGLYY